MTPNQIQGIVNIILRNTLFFISTNIGRDILTAEDNKKLLELGIDIKKIPPGLTAIEKSYLFGQLAAVVENADLKKLTYKQFLNYLETKQYLPLTSVQEGSIKALKQFAYNDIKGLGNRYTQRLTQTILIHDDKLRKLRERKIKDTAIKAVEEGKTARWLQSELRTATEDWNRDWARTADYLMHHSHSQGIIDMLSEIDGGNAKVYLDVYPGACAVCIKSYLTGGLGSRPRVFKITTLQDNGTNIVRKAVNWLPVIPPMHPNCRCQVQRFIEGSEWDSETGRFKKPKYEGKKDRPKVKVKIGNRTFEG